MRLATWSQDAWQRMLDSLDADTASGRRRINLLLLASVVVLTALSVAFGSRSVPGSTLVVPLVAGGLLLDPWRLRLLILVTAAGLATVVGFDGLRQVRIATFVVVAAVALIAYVLTVDRQRLGLSVGRGEAMLIELRDSLERQGQPPPLPAAWHAEVARRPAGGASFGGDFLVAALTGDGGTLELALVDVSGKGVDAGTRSLLLSGALGSLLGAVPASEFLHAANAYLLQQNWDEGFATCVHVAVDLGSGDFRVGNAGHPPVAHYSGGSGRWDLVEVDGTALGIVAEPVFHEAAGHVRPQDALLLYTDGLIEVPGRELELGIDRLLGATERIISRGFEGGAELLIDSAARGDGLNDDRALVLLWRTS